MAGTLDTTFGNNSGWTANTFNPGVDSRGNSSVLDSSGRLVVTGYTMDPTGAFEQLIVARYTSNGSLDTTFGTNGWTATTFNPGVDSGGTSLVLDSSGRLLVTGYIADPTGAVKQLLVARYTSNGILDTTFGTNGWTASIFNLAVYSRGKSLVLDSSGRIIVVGDTFDSNKNFSQLLVARYTSNGILDTTFGTNGWTATTFNHGVDSAGISLVLDSSGRLLVTGYTKDPTNKFYQLLVARYTSNGILDTKFGTNGWTATTFNPGVDSTGNSLVLDSSGRLLVTGTTKDPTNKFYQLLVARYTSNGILDTKFGTNGWTATTFNPGVDSGGTSLVLDSSGRLLVTGYIVDLRVGLLLLVARYTTAGILDNTFGTNGWTATNFDGGAYGNSLLLDSSGRLVVTGYTVKVTTNSLRDGLFTLLVVRYLNEATEPICLPAGTPIVTDQGIIKIEQLDPQKHTINHKPIIAITTTVTPEKHLICFEANSMGINCPTRRTLMTPGHEVLYKGKLVQAKHFVGRLNGVHTVPYNGRDILYNVLQRQHGLMVVNNMVLETLHPMNKVAREILDNL